MFTTAQIEKNLQQIKGTIKLNGYNFEKLNLIAITKQQPREIIQRCHSLGLTSIGENRAEEIEAKRETLTQYSDLKLHFIGNIQSRKIKLLPQNLYSFDSINSLKTAQKLENWLLTIDRHNPLPVLLQVNPTTEPQKSGFLFETKSGIAIPQEAMLEVIEFILNSDKLKLNGLMAMGPTPISEHSYIMGNPKYENDTSKAFENTANLKSNIEKRYNTTLERLSLGMSHDYLLALEQGANEVRIGSLLVGARRLTVQ